MKKLSFSKKEYVEPFFIYSLSVLSIVFLSFLHVAPISKQTENYEQKILNELAQPTHIFSSGSFNDVEIEAKAYVVYDLVEGRVIAGRNENETLPLASITKVMTAVTALLHLPKNQSVVITPDIIDGSYDLGLKNKQVWELGELLKYVLIFSSNDGAEAIAKVYGGRDKFVDQMNADAEALGFKFIFTDPSGLDHGNSLGGKGSALDAAKLLGIAKREFPDILDATTKKRQSVYAGNTKLTGVPNTNQSIEELFGAEGSKTGFTDLAGGNLGVIVDVSLGRPVAIVVLGSSREGRFKDVKTLYETLKKSLNVPTEAN
jgi:D-alanyl-D-alanine carboxypeptidase